MADGLITGRGRANKPENGKTGCQSLKQFETNPVCCTCSKSKARREESGLHKPSQNQVKYLSALAKPKLQTQLLHPLFAVLRDLP